MHVLWLGVLSDEIEARVAQLKKGNYAIEHFENKTQFFDKLKSLIEKNDRAQILTILSSHSVSTSIELCKQVKAAAPSPPIIFASVEKASVEHREQFFSAGGDDLIIEPYAHQELGARIDKYKDFLAKEQRLQSEIEMSGNMAMLAMESSSDIGGILEFAKKALEDRSYQGIASAIFHTTLAYASGTIVEIHGHSDTHFFESKHSGRELESEINRFRSDTRVVSSGDIIQINQTHILVQVKGLPEGDQEKMGRISDNMSTLVEMANRFVISANRDEHIVQLETLRSDFINTIGNELRTRLKVVQTFSANLMKKPPGEPLGEKHAMALKGVHENVSKINRIINTIIDINALSTEKESLNMDKKVAISPLISKIADQYTAKAKRNNSTIKIGEQCSGALRTNEKFLIQVLCHLIDNAAKFTKEGTITLSSYEKQTSKGKDLAIHIRDTGPGLSKEDASIILSKNISSDSRAHNNHSGFGLLYVRLFGNLLGGDISIKSAPQKGSEFILTFFEKNAVTVQSQVESSNTELF